MLSLFVSTRDARLPLCLLFFPFFFSFTMLVRVHCAQWRHELWGPYHPRPTLDFISPTSIYQFCMAQHCWYVTWQLAVHHSCLPSLWSTFYLTIRFCSFNSCIISNLFKKHFVTLYNRIHVYLICAIHLQPPSDPLCTRNYIQLNFFSRRLPVHCIHIPWVLLQFCISTHCTKLMDHTVSCDIILYLSVMLMRPAMHRLHHPPTTPTDRSPEKIHYCHIRSFTLVKSASPIHHFHNENNKGKHPFRWALFVPRAISALHCVHNPHTHKPTKKGNLSPLFNMFAVDNRHHSSPQLDDYQKGYIQLF